MLLTSLATRLIPSFPTPPPPPPCLPAPSQHNINLIVHIAFTSDESSHTILRGEEKEIWLTNSHRIIKGTLTKDDKTIGERIVKNANLPNERGGAPAREAQKQVV